SSTKLDLSGYGFVAMSPGPDVRFLFMGFNNGNAAVVNSRGEVIKRTTIWAGAGSWGAAGASDTSFLVLRSLISDGLPVLSYRLDRDGNLVSSDDSRLPIDRLHPGEETIAGGADGFLLIHEQGVGTIQQRTESYHLDANGVFINERVLTTGLAGSVVAREDDSYLAIWIEGGGNTNAREVVARISLDNVVTSRSEFTLPAPSGLSLVSYRGQRVVVSSLLPLAANDEDVYVQMLPETLQPGTPRLVTFSGTAQRYADLAAGANGYAVTWFEYEPDKLAHLYVRRFSESGAPQDILPIPIAALMQSL